jgi:hypothetical protein
MDSCTRLALNCIKVCGGKDREEQQDLGRWSKAGQLNMFLVDAPPHHRRLPLVLQLRDGQQQTPRACSAGRPCLEIHSKYGLWSDSPKAPPERDTHGPWATVQQPYLGIAHCLLLLLETSAKDAN